MAHIQSRHSWFRLSKRGLAVKFRMLVLAEAVLVTDRFEHVKPDGALLIFKVAWFNLDKVSLRATASALVRLKFQGHASLWSRVSVVELGFAALNFCHEISKTIFLALILILLKQLLGLFRRCLNNHLG